MRIAMFMPGLNTHSLGWQVHLDFADAMRALGHRFTRMCCNFQKAARERLIKSAGLRLMQPPRTAC